MGRASAEGRWDRLLLRAEGRNGKRPFHQRVQEDAKRPSIGLPTIVRLAHQISPVQRSLRFHISSSAADFLGVPVLRRDRPRIC